ncbi:hypothetical protein J2S74_005589, partial [Evansella vedderi]|nr:hypothetical protein [Evansella vedderi]
MMSIYPFFFFLQENIIGIFCYIIYLLLTFLLDFYATLV